MRWDEAAVTWRLPSQELEPIYATCDDAVCKAKGDQIEEFVFRTEYPTSNSSYTLKCDIILLLVSILLFIIIL